jgi:hypothetical protein
MVCERPETAGPDGLLRGPQGSSVPRANEIAYSSNAAQDMNLQRRPDRANGLRD